MALLRPSPPLNRSKKAIIFIFPGTGLPAPRREDGLGLRALAGRWTSPVSTPSTLRNLLSGPASRQGALVGIAPPRRVHRRSSRAMARTGLADFHLALWLTLYIL